MSCLALWCCRHPSILSKATATQLQLMASRQLYGFDGEIPILVHEEHQGAPLLATTRTWSSGPLTAAGKAILSSAPGLWLFQALRVHTFACQHSSSMPPNAALRLPVTYPMQSCGTS